MSSNNSNTEPTTLGSYVQHGTGLVQETVGGLLGNENMKQQGTANIQTAQSNYNQLTEAANSNAPSKTTG